MAMHVTEDLTPEFTEQGLGHRTIAGGPPFAPAHLEAPEPAEAMA